jgi:hypothetical protein
MNSYIELTQLNLDYDINLIYLTSINFPMLTI